MLLEHFVVKGACHVHANLISCNRLVCDALSAQSALVQFVFCRKTIDVDNASTINRLSAEHKLQFALIRHHKVGINHSNTTHEDHRLPRLSWCFCWSELVSKDHRLILRPTALHCVVCMSLHGLVLYAGGRGVAMSPKPASDLHRLP